MNREVVNVSKEQKNRQNKDLKMAVSGEKVLNCWLKLRDFIKAFYPDIEIVSINPVGLKGLFKDCYQNEKGELEYE